MLRVHLAEAFFCTINTFVSMFDQTHKDLKKKEEAKVRDTVYCLVTHAASGCWYIYAIHISGTEKEDRGEKEAAHARDGGSKPIQVKIECIAKVEKLLSAEKMIRLEVVWLVLYLWLCLCISLDLSDLGREVQPAINARAYFCTCPIFHRLLLEK